jgi:hypothetical protein
MAAGGERFEVAREMLNQKVSGHRMKAPWQRQGFVKLIDDGFQALFE